MFGFLSKLEAEMRRQAGENRSRRVVASWATPWTVRVHVCKAWLRVQIPAAIRTSLIALLGLYVLILSVQRLQPGAIPDDRWLVIGLVLLAICWSIPAAGLAALRAGKTRISTVGIEYGKRPRDICRWSEIRQIRYCDADDLPGVVEVTIDAQGTKPVGLYIGRVEFEHNVLPILLERAAVERAQEQREQIADAHLQEGSNAAQNYGTSLHADMLWGFLATLLLVPMLAAVLTFRKAIFGPHFDPDWLQIVILLFGPGTIAMLLRHGWRFYRQPTAPTVAFGFNMLCLVLSSLGYLLMDLWLIKMAGPAGH